jgi:hypothetical protein
MESNTSHPALMCRPIIAAAAGTAGPGLTDTHHVPALSSLIRDKIDINFTKLGQFCLEPRVDVSDDTIGFQPSKFVN